MAVPQVVDVTQILREAAGPARQLKAAPHLVDKGLLLAQKIRCDVQVGPVMADGSRQELIVGIIAPKELVARGVNSIIDTLYKHGEVVVARQEKGSAVVVNGHKHFLSSFCDKSRGIVDSFAQYHDSVRFKLVVQQPSDDSETADRTVRQVQRGNRRK
jgi:hypothetical protein